MTAGRSRYHHPHTADQSAGLDVQVVFTSGRALGNPSSRSTKTLAKGAGATVVRHAIVPAMSTDHLTHNRPVGHMRHAASKVPEVTVFFWIIKVLTTGMGETASDFLAHW